MFCCHSEVLTSPFEENHDVSRAAGDLLEVQRDDIAVQFEGVGDGVVHLSPRQVRGVLCYPVAGATLTVNITLDSHM